MVDADRCMWDYHWVMGTGPTPSTSTRRPASRRARAFLPVRRGEGPLRRTFEGMVQVMKDYVKTRGTYLDTKSADTAIPNTPDDHGHRAAGFPDQCLDLPDLRLQRPARGRHVWRPAMADRGGGARHAGPCATDRSDVVLVPDGASWKYFKGTKRALHALSPRGARSTSTIPRGCRARPHRLRRDLHRDEPRRHAGRLHQRLLPQDLRRRRPIDA